MQINYPALFYYDKSDASQNDNYFVYFPDFRGSGTQGFDITDAMTMASDYLGIIASSIIESTESLPTPSNINQLSLIKNNPFINDSEVTLQFSKEKSFISMVMVNLSDYLSTDDSVKKTLTIPKWADQLGKEMHINFSKTLTEAIAKNKLPD